MLRLCWLWRCQCTYALTRPGGLLSVISRCFRHWSEHCVSSYFLYDFSLFCSLARVTLCGIGDFRYRRGGFTCPTAFCMRSSSVSKGTACSSGSHKHRRKRWIVVGGEGVQPESNLCKLQICVMYRGGIPVSESSAMARTREWTLFAFSWMNDTAAFIFTIGSSRRPR